MTARRLLAAGFTVVLVASSAVARADVIEPYVAESSSTPYSSACASAYSGDWATDTWSMTCADTIDNDGDGESEETYISFASETCTNADNTTRCDYWSGYDRFSPTAAVVDLDAGTASWTADFDGCHVEANLVATDEQGPSALDIPFPRAWGPDVRSSRMEVQVAAVGQDHDRDADADGSGVVCDGFSGDFDYASMGGTRERRTEVGLRINPEDLPVAGPAFERGESNGQASSSDAACAYWVDDSSTAWSYVDSCGEEYDDTNDGQSDFASISAYRVTCDASSCEARSFFADVDPAQVSVDVAAGTAAFFGTLGPCGDGDDEVDVTLTGIGDVDSEHSSYESDTVGVDPETGRVIVGYRDDRTWSSRRAVPDAGAAVCGWAEPAANTDAGGAMQSEAWNRTDRYVAVNPGAVGP